MTVIQNTTIKFSNVTYVVTYTVICYIFALFSLFQAHDIEFAQIEHQVLDGLKVGNESLKALHAVFKLLIYFV